jgi:hypothetical protein
VVLAVAVRVLVVVAAGRVVVAAGLAPVVVALGAVVVVAEVVVAEVVVAEVVVAEVVVAEGVEVVALGAVVVVAGAPLKLGPGSSTSSCLETFCPVVPGALAETVKVAGVDSGGCSPCTVTAVAWPGVRSTVVDTC